MRSYAGATMPPPVVRRVVVLALLLPASAGCGDQAGPSGRVDGVDPPVTIVDGEVQVACDPSPHLNRPT